MENEFTDVMSQRTDRDLIQIVTSDRGKYQPEALEAADAEIKSRNIDTSTFNDLREQSIIERQKRDAVISDLAPGHLRLVNHIIDILVSYILSMFVFLICSLFLPEIEGPLVTIVVILLVFGTFMSYYVIMEVAWQKTLGKFATKTKVVLNNGERPKEKDIVIRTLCRLIPFDRISFLFMKQGFHDVLSKTKVIKD